MGCQAVTSGWKSGWGGRLWRLQNGCWAVENGKKWLGRNDMLNPPALGSEPAVVSESRRK